MAQSIFEILDTLKTTTSVPGHGAEVPHTLPRHLFPTSEQPVGAYNCIQKA